MKEYNKNSNSVNRPEPGSIGGILSRLEKVTSVGRDRWRGCCPAHDDKNPSLVIAVKGSRILVHCWAGCSFEEIRDALGLTSAAFFTDTTPYIQRLTSRVSYEWAEVRQLMFDYGITRELAEAMVVNRVEQKGAPV